MRYTYTKISYHMEWLLYHACIQYVRAGNTGPKQCPVGGPAAIGTL